MATAYSAREVGEPGVAWHALPGNEAAARLGVTAELGLSEGEASGRLATHGPNRLRVHRQEPFVEEFLEELREPMILLLLGTGVLYGLWGGIEDALTLLLVTITLVTIEVVNERRAARAIASLHRLAEPKALVRRSGALVEVDAEAVVPGDVLLLVAGRRVAADARLVEAHDLTLDESALTGESTPVRKASQHLPAETQLADRANMVHAGTTVGRGHGAAMVVATGPDTELGRIAALAQTVKPPKTPLQRAMNDLSRSLLWVALAVSALVPLLGLLAGQPPRLMVLTGLSLAFAMIPEEMPIIITMVLALGGYRLSRRRAIVRDLRAVETLGAVTVIATDKTGTLTENRMAVSRLEPSSATSRLLRLGLMASDATVRSGATPPWADPMELALARAVAADSGAAEGLGADTVVADLGFDDSRGLASTIYRSGDALALAVKGSPEAVLARSTHALVDGQAAPLGESARSEVLARVAALAADGDRVIAVAERRLPDAVTDRDGIEADLAFVGLVTFADPPRAGVTEAIAATASAGVRTIMVTGDHPVTARAIAARTGLDTSGRVVTGAEIDGMADGDLAQAVEYASVFARTTAEHKLRIVQALRAHGERVAVTGDGINDAPALAAADIGIAMGETGTDVAREAGDLVLADDNFATIVAAIEQGRVLFANLSKGVRYYLACKVALAGATLLAALLGVPVPFAPVQIILMELFMDLAAAATFVAEPAEAGLMLRPPRDPEARFLDRPMVAGILRGAVGLFGAVSVAYLWAWYGGGGLAQAQTTAFATWLVGHVLLAVNMRAEREPLYRLGLLTNRAMLLWGAATVAFVLVAVCVPAARGPLGTTALPAGHWLPILALAVLGTFWLEVPKVLGRNDPRSAPIHTD